MEILDYWKTHPYSEHNGVFSAGLIGGGGGTLVLITDCFGMGPLYYRKIGHAVVFSTNPRYLMMEGDSPDLLAWRCLLQAGFISSDRTLSASVKRVPAGSAVSFTGGTSRTVSWFNFDRLPTGSKPVSRNTVGEVEEAFQESMRRCLRLQSERILLSLSSGHDTRRILATMLRRSVDFTAITARVFQKQHRDLDARFAAEMARDFGFRHTIIEPGTPDEYAADDRARHVLVDAETDQHTWVLPLMKSLPRQPCLFFDGIAGDILGSPVGWSVVFGLEHVGRSPEDQVEAIANRCTTGLYDSLFRSGRWPDLAQVRDDIRTYLRTFLPRENIDEIAFILLRQRRSTSLWSQQLLPAGHVVVCPYLDLDYVRLLLDFKPADKRATVFQRSCLKEFWPQFYRYPGNRDIPDDLPPGSPAFRNDRILKCRAWMWDEIASHSGMPLLRGLLSPKGLLALECSKRSRALALRTSWFLNPLMELVARQVRTNGCWEWGTR